MPTGPQEHYLFKQVVMQLQVREQTHYERAPNAVLRTQTARTASRARTGDSSPAGLMTGRSRLRQWARDAIRVTQAKELEKKRARAAKRLAKHTWRMRAPRGLLTTLETITTGAQTSQDYQVRVTSFLAFVGRWSLPIDLERVLD